MDAEAQGSAAERNWWEKSASPVQARRGGIPPLILKSERKKWFDEWDLPRAGISLLIAALSASGTSTIHNIEQIDSGYENIDERLKAIGAKIERC